MFFKNNNFTNYVVLTNNLNFKFLITLLLIFNLFFFYKSQDFLKKILSALLNLFFLTFIIIQKSNEAFAYLFLLTEMSALLVLTPIILNKNDSLCNKKNINLSYFYFILFLTTIYCIFNYNFNTRYNIFVDNIKESNNNFNDLYSLFLILNYNHSL